MLGSFVTQETIACQALLSMGFSRQEYWSELLFPSPGDLPNPEIEPMSPEVAGEFFTTEPPGKPKSVYRLLNSSQNKVEDITFWDNDKVSLGNTGLFTVKES